MKVEITDWKLLAKIVWNLELWYQDNYRTLDNAHRHIMRMKIDGLTNRLEVMRKDKLNAQESK